MCFYLQRFFKIIPHASFLTIKTFGVEGKLSKYNKNFNNISLFDNPDLLNTFMNYGLQDSVALYNALINAQLSILTDFKLDITSKNIVSTSSLAFNVFRLKFQQNDIPILNNAQ